MSENQQMKEYSVDLVICIDGTGSMTRMIEKVKASAKDFYMLFYKAMKMSPNNKGSLF